MTLRIIIRPGKIGARGPTWDVLCNGETIVNGSRDPEHEAARELLARGHSGSFEVWDEVRPYPRSIGWDIERTAGLSITEEDARGLRVRRHREWGSHGDGSEVPVLPGGGTEFLASRLGDVPEGQS